MGCMPLSTSQIHAFPNVFSLFPKVWTTQLWWSCQGNSSSWRLFLHLTTGPFYGQHSEHERAFSSDVALGPGLPYCTIPGDPRHMVFCVCLRGHHSHHQELESPLELCYPEALHGTPALPYTSYLAPSHYLTMHQFAAELTSTLSWEAWRPQGGYNNDFHGNGILQPTRCTWSLPHISKSFCGARTIKQIQFPVLSREIQQFSFKTVGIPWPWAWLSPSLSRALSTISRCQVWSNWIQNPNFYF